MKESGCTTTIDTTGTVSKTSKEVQATLLQCTQITNEDRNTHIKRGKRINETMSSSMALRHLTLQTENNIWHFAMLMGETLA
jgi:hypothetical protein